MDLFYQKVNMLDLNLQADILSTLNGKSWVVCQSDIGQKCNLMSYKSSLENTETSVVSPHSHFLQ